MNSGEFPKYIDNYSIWNKLRRLFWNISYYILFFPFGLPIFNEWRNFVLKLFGAKIGEGCIVHSTATIWAPWNLECANRVCIGPYSIIYNPGKITLGNKVCISQYAYLCTATHNYTSRLNTLYWKPIKIDDYAWVAARSFVGPGVHIGEYAIVGATSSVYKDIAPFDIVGGNPAKFIKKRKLED